MAEGGAREDGAEETKGDGEGGEGARQTWGTGRTACSLERGAGLRSGRGGEGEREGEGRGTKEQKG